MQRPTVLLLALLALTALLTGCLGSLGGTDRTAEPTVPASQPPTATGSSSDNVPRAELGADGQAPDQVPDGQGGNLTVLSFGQPSATTVVWANGSFQAQEACIPAGCAQEIVTGSETTQHRADISDHIPAGVPVHVNVTVTWDEESFDFIGAEINTTGADLYRYEETAEQGTATASAALVRSQAGTVNAAADASIVGPQGADYTLRAQITPLGASLADGVPVAVDLPSGTNLTLLQPAQENRSATLKVWDPADGLVTTASLDGQATITLPGTSARGEYVVQVTGANATLAAAPVQDRARLRALTVGISFLEATQLSPGQQTLTLEGQLQAAPMAVGVYARGDGPTWASDGITGELAGPNGTLFTLDENGGACLLCTGGSVIWTERTDPGQPGVVAGSYEATLEATLEARTEVGLLTVTYQR